MSQKSATEDEASRTRLVLTLINIVEFQQCGMCDQQRLRAAAHTRSLIRAFASRLNFLWVLSY